MDHVQLFRIYGFMESSCPFVLFLFIFLNPPKSLVLRPVRRHTWDTHAYVSTHTHTRSLPHTLAQSHAWSHTHLFAHTHTRTVMLDRTHTRTHTHSIAGPEGHSGSCLGAVSSRCSVARGHIATPVLWLDKNMGCVLSSCLVERQGPPPSPQLILSSIKNT